MKRGRIIGGNHATSSETAVGRISGFGRSDSVNGRTGLALSLININETLRRSSHLSRVPINKEINSKAFWCMQFIRCTLDPRRLFRDIFNLYGLCEVVKTMPSDKGLESLKLGNLLHYVEAQRKAKAISMVNNMYSAARLYGCADLLWSWMRSACMTYY